MTKLAVDLPLALRDLVFPPSMPLAPLLRALPYQLIDMFEEFPKRFLYISETRPDMD